MVLRFEKLSRFSRPRKQPHPPIAQERESILKELGGYLRQTRLQQSLTLDEIGVKTMIPVRLLQAIEEGRIDRLPEPVYVQAFLRRYADVLGVNGAEFSSSFPVNSSVTMAPKETILSGFSLSNLQPIHLYLLYLGLIILSVSGLSARLNSTPQALSTAVGESTLRQPRSAENPVQAQASKKIISPRGAASKALTTPLKPPVKVSGVNASVTLKTESWLEVNADGGVVYEGTLPQGTTKVWKAKQTLAISAGNAGGVLVSVNGKPAKPIGADGAVESATFNSENPVQDQSIP